MKDFKLKLDGAGRGKLWIDGEEVTGVRAVTVSARVGQANSVTVEYGARLVEVEGSAEIHPLDGKPFVIGETISRTFPIGQQEALNPRWVK